MVFCLMLKSVVDPIPVFILSGIAARKLTSTVKQILWESVDW